MKKAFRFIGIFLWSAIPILSGSLHAKTEFLHSKSTNVGGHITANTTWTSAGSPYIVIEDVIVDSGITLKIETGVEVRLDSMKCIMVYGTLSATGTEGDSIIISALDTTKRWSNLYFKDASAGSLSYCRIEYAKYCAIYDWTASSLVIEHNTITNNNNSGGEGGGISSGGSPTIIDNAITRNSTGSGGGIYNYKGSPTISGNTITENSASYGGGIFSSEGSPTISGNTIMGNSAEDGGGIYSCYGTPTIKYNTIIDTTASAIYITDASALIDSNNLYATGYAVYNDYTFYTDARYNYWGTTSSDTIDMKIWDFYDDSAKGIVYYEPFLSESLDVGVEEASNYQLTISNYQLSIYPNPFTQKTSIQ